MRTKQATTIEVFFSDLSPGDTFRVETKVYRKVGQTTAMCLGCDENPGEYGYFYTFGVASVVQKTVS